MGYSVLNEILNGKRPVTTNSALMFEAAFGYSCRFSPETADEIQYAYCEKIMLWLKSSSRFAELQPCYKTEMRPHNTAAFLFL